MMLLRIFKSYASRLIPKDTFFRMLVLHSTLMMALWAIVSLLAAKYVVRYPYGVLMAMTLLSFGLGILQIARLRTAQISEKLLKSASVVLLTTLQACIILCVFFRNTLYTDEVIIIPLAGMAVFFMERAFSEWGNMPAYAPPFTTLEHYHQVMGLRVFADSTNFICFAIHGPKNEQTNMPASIGWSVEKKSAFHVPLKDLFSAYVLYNNYNQRAALQISVAGGRLEEASEKSQKEEPYCWAFYTRRCFFWRRYLDPERSLYDSNVGLRFSLLKFSGTLRLIHKKTIYATYNNKHQS